MMRYKSCCMAFLVGVVFIASLASAAQADDHLVFITDVQPSPGSTISTDQPQISFVAYLKNNLRQKTLIRVEIMGCGTFSNTSDHQLVEMPISPDLVADNGVTEAWSITADLATAGCTLDFPDGFQVVVTITANSTTTYPPFLLFSTSNTVSWTFTIDNPSASPIDFDPPTPLLIESLSPSVANEGSTITVRGSGFVEPSTLNRSTGSRAYMMLEDGPTLVPTSVNSSTELTFTVPSDIPCGQHLVQIRNDGVFLTFAGNLVQQSVPIGFEVRCPLEVLNPIPPGEDPPPGDNEQPGYEVVDLDLPPTASVGEEINGSAEISYRGLSSDTESEMRLYINNDLEDTRQVSVDPNSSEWFPLSFSFNQPGNYLVRVEVGEDELSSTISVEAQNGGGNDDPPPPSPPTGGDLSNFDENGNCMLDDIEFFGAVDAWIAGSLSNNDFFAAVDAWIGQSDICASAVGINSNSPLAIQSTARAVRIMGTAEAQHMFVEFYDLNGNLIASERSASNSLTWNLRSATGQRVANGVYFYRVEMTSAAGEITHSALKKLVVMQ